MARVELERLDVRIGSATAVERRPTAFGAEVLRAEVLRAEVLRAEVLRAEVLGSRT